MKLPSLHLLSLMHVGADANDGERAKRRRSKQPAAPDPPSDRDLMPPPPPQRQAAGPQQPSMVMVERERWSGMQYLGSSVVNFLQSSVKRFANYLVPKGMNTQMFLSEQLMYAKGVFVKKGGDGEFTLSGVRFTSDAIHEKVVGIVMFVLWGPDRPRWAESKQIVRNFNGAFYGDLPGEAPKQNLREVAEDFISAVLEEFANQYYVQKRRVLPDFRPWLERQEFGDEPRETLPNDPGMWGLWFLSWLQFWALALPGLWRPENWPEPKPGKRRVTARQILFDLPGGEGPTEDE